MRKFGGGGVGGCYGWGVVGVGGVGDGEGVGGYGGCFGLGVVGGFGWKI